MLRKTIIDRAFRLLSAVVLTFSFLPVLATPPVEAAEKADINVTGRFEHAAKIVIEKIDIVQLEDRSFREYGDLDRESLQTYINNYVVGTYQDVDIGDDDQEYTLSKGGCTGSKIQIRDSGDVNFENMSIKKSGNSGCTDILEGDLTISGMSTFNITNINMFFRWQNPSSMVRVDGKWGVFQQHPIEKDNYESLEKPDNYVTNITKETDNTDLATYHQGDKDRGDKNRNVVIGSAVNRDDDESNDEATNIDVATGSANEPTCESETNNDFGWVLCAGLGLIDDTFSSMQSSVDELLDINENEFNSPELKATWSYFKNVATFLLILIGLIMIIGQAVSRE